VRVVLLLAFILTAAACGSPTSPSASAQPSPAGFEGVWELEYVPDTCTGLRHCFAVLNKPSTITLRALRGASGFDGVVILGPGNNVDVSGSLAGGALSLRGTRPAAVANDAEVEITRLELRRERTEFSGHFEYSARGPSNSSFFGSSRVGGPITAARLLGPLDTAGFTGGWHGRVAIRECSSVGWPDCFPHEPRDTYPLQIALVQEGGAVAGTLRILGSTVMTVEGTAAGDAITLQGSSTEPNYAFDEVRTLRPSTLRRDAVGRLHGVISLQIAWPPKLPDLWTYKATDLRVVELISVALTSS